MSGKNVFSENKEDFRFYCIFYMTRTRTKCKRNNIFTWHKLLLISAYSSFGILCFMSSGADVLTSDGATWRSKWERMQNKYDFKLLIIYIYIYKRPHIKLNFTSTLLRRSEIDVVLLKMRVRIVGELVLTSTSIFSSLVASRRFDGIFKPKSRKLLEYEPAR